MAVLVGLSETTLVEESVSSCRYHSTMALHAHITSGVLITSNEDFWPIALKILMKSRFKVQDYLIITQIVSFIEARSYNNDV
jgi:hypothetical protein